MCVYTDMYLDMYFTTGYRRRIYKHSEEPVAFK